jgi:hypothetical protein
VIENLSIILNSHYHFQTHWRILGGRFGAGSPGLIRRGGNCRRKPLFFCLSEFFGSKIVGNLGRQANLSEIRGKWQQNEANLSEKWGVGPAKKGAVGAAKGSKIFAPWVFDSHDTPLKPQCKINYYLLCLFSKTVRVSMSSKTIDKCRQIGLTVNHLIK